MFGHRRPLLVVLPAVLAVVVSLLTPTTASAAVDDSAPLPGWRPDNGHTYALQRSGDTMFLGGDFTWMRGPDGTVVRRYGLAAVSLTTGALLPWAPAVDGTVWSLELAPDGQSLYVGGTFGTVAGTARANLARVTTGTGAVSPFRADTNGQVWDTELRNGSLYVVGSFSTVGGQNRSRGATVDPGTGALGTWNPRANAGIRAITFDSAGAVAYLGGAFTTLSSTDRQFAGAVSATTGALDPWVPRSSCNDVNNPCYVFDVVVSDDLVYLAVGGPGGRVTALDRQSGFERWWMGTDGDVQELELTGRKLVVGGHFDTSFAGYPRAGITMLDARSGAVLPDIDARVVGWSGVWALSVDDTRLALGGHFETVDGVTTRRYVAFPVVADPADTAAPSAPSALRAPAVLSDEVTLTWGEATDNVAVSHYVVRRDGIEIGEANKPFFRDRTALSATQYRYTVAAVDTAGNTGAPTTALTVTTEGARGLLVGRTTPVRFLSTGNAPAGTWTATAYDDASWSTGAGEFGFGDGDEDTFISPLGVTHYFRSAFTVPDLAAVGSPRLRLLLDDGAVAYLNGTELARENMPAGTPSNTTVASSSIGGTGEMDWSTFTIPAGRIVQGANVLAVEVHNAGATSSDVSYAARIEYTPQGPPATPTGLTATATSSSTVDLAWSATSGATGYRVLRDGATVATVASPAFTDTGLSASTAYAYRVVATNAGGASAPSAEVPVTTPAAPAPPDAPEAPTLSSPSATSVQVSWPAVAGATSYGVRRDGVPVGTTATTSFLDTGLSPETTYTYTVLASNSSGSSAPGPGASVTTPVAPPLPPDAPTGLAASAVTSTSLTLGWQAVGTADTYTVRRNGVDVGTVSGTTFADTGLSADVAYSYTVTAANANGSGAPSPPLAVRTRTLLLSGDAWRMNGTGADLGTAWRAPGYVDSAWQSGRSQWGFGDGDEQTVLTWANNPRPITAYGRAAVDVGPSTAGITGLRMRLLVDDGAVVYLNGTEVHRFNLPTGTIGYQTRASRFISGAEENQWRTVDLPASALVPGRNVVAVEVHQDQPSSSDLSLDMELSPIR